LAGLKSDVDARLEGLLDSKLDAVKVHGREVVEVVSAIRDLCLRGGKRLRPALIVTGYRAASSRGSLDPAVDAGVALELLQAFFLIHDDWMDGDEVRRGGPAVHAILSERFGSREAGARAGILAGDHAQALALEVLARLEIRPERLQAVLSAFTQMQLDAVMGQQLDVLGPEVLSFGKRSRDVDGVARTEATYVLKTGSYTVRGPLRMGALLGGAGPDLLATLDRFSLPVGVAFQLRDDLLGVFGEPEQTGKPLGSDLKTAKRTVLLLTALERANARDGKLLRSVLGNAAATDAEVRAATQVFERSGARAVVEGRIEELVNSARSALAAGRLSPEGRALLEGAADVLTARRT
jgi:geranylgeranyl diphosphate synthase type I